MCKIFYCGGSSGRLGMLRAVIPLVEFANVLSETGADYVGESFPDFNQDSVSCTVIEVAADEEERNWKAGFYRVERKPLDFEDSLRTLRSAASGAI